MNKNSAPSMAGKKRNLTITNDPEFKLMYMNGIKVYIPKNIELYSTQKKMINWSLKAANESKNALIESPTGSASFCSWLTKYEIDRRNKPPCPVHGYIFTVEDPSNDADAAEEEASTSSLEEKPSKKSPKIETDTEVCNCMPKVRIYYCTRTHKQISQVVNEYKRLPFHQMGTLKHTILASREQSCCNQAVRKMGNDLNANCRSVLQPKGGGCTYRENLKTMAGGREGSSIRNKLSRKHIDNLLKNCRDAHLDICPYFLTNRELTKDANIFFCPFNYLVDPVVREASDIVLKNSIIILDEAHNIEDVCRSAASFEFTDLEFSTALANLEAKIEETNKKTGGNYRQLFLDNLDSDGKRDRHQTLNNYSSCMQKWHDYLSKMFNKLKVLSAETEMAEQDKFSKSQFLNIDSNRLTNLLSSVYLAKNSDEYSDYLSAFNQLAQKPDSADKNIVDVLSDSELQLSSATIVLIEKFLFFFKYHSDEENRKFYKGHIEISMQKTQPHYSQTQSRVEPPKRLIPGRDVKFSFWSMMPSIAFKDAFSQSRSIILASGTLTPNETFCSELGVNFDYKMSGEQIVPPERIFAASISTGPTNKALRLTYANLSNAIPELVQLILDVCKIVPAGVLVFASSYRMLDQLEATLNKTGLIKELKAVKEVFYEPRSSRDMTEFLNEYEYAIKKPKKKLTGAVMFAVFRGKVSEGLNFADDRARAVISIGIPYPSVGDQQVKQKKLFNDQNAKNYNLLPANEWYEIQAFRAINQALGRCLRHKNDWGSLILVDERYNSNQMKISGWVREQMKPFKHAALCKALGEFVTFHVNNPVEKTDSSFADDD
ncbi:DNA helicase [Aphelenchoides bicaudatus]|nr:DNA helicase [Aphelenchoides bicaudatus]